MCHIGHKFNDRASTGKTIHKRAVGASLSHLGPACRAVSPWFQSMPRADVFNSKLIII